MSATAQINPGTIQAAKVDGLVSKLAANGTTTPLKDGEKLTETDTVITAKGASVVLVFANGASVKLGSDSRLAIDEFKIDPFAEDVKVSELKNEPSKSKTALNLAYGEMVGDVKKLNTSSSYSIKTPVGAAGIRGTIYRIVFRPDANGKATFTISTLEGKVVAIAEGVIKTEVAIEAGKEIAVVIDTNNPTAPKVETQNLSQETKDAFTKASTTITEVLNTVTIPSSSTTTETPPATTPPPPPPPPVTTPTLTLTVLEGK